MKSPASNESLIAELDRQLYDYKRKAEFDPHDDDEWCVSLTARQWREVETALEAQSPQEGQVAERDVRKLGGAIFDATCDWDSDAYESMGDAQQTQLIASLASSIAQHIVASAAPRWVRQVDADQGRVALNLKLYVANGRVVEPLLAPVSQEGQATLAVGWKMVPVEPTEAMLRAGFNAEFEPPPSEPVTWLDERHVWAAMLAHAPQAPPSEEGWRAWLIETPQTDNSPARWWNPETGWMIDPNKGLRLCREEDAAAVIKATRGLLPCRPIEHKWLPAPPDPVLGNAEGEGT